MGWLAELTARFKRLLTPSEPPGKCGAIALAFVYRRLGKKVPLEAIWKSVRIEKESPRPGLLASSDSLMCRDALNRGMRAIDLNARYEKGLELLKEARRRRVEVILCHGTEDPAWTHCSVLEGFEGDSWDVFDPTNGTFSTLSSEDLREVWGRWGDEGGHHCLVAVTPEVPESSSCSGCGHPIPSWIQCPEPGCLQSISIEPAFLLGCANRECPEAAWEAVYCPYCGTAIDDLREWSAW